MEYTSDSINKDMYPDKWQGRVKPLNGYSHTVFEEAMRRYNRLFELQQKQNILDQTISKTIVSTAKMQSTNMDHIKCAINSQIEKQVTKIKKAYTLKEETTKQCIKDKEGMHIRIDELRSLVVSKSKELSAISKRHDQLQLILNEKKCIVDQRESRYNKLYEKMGQIGG